MQFAEKILTAKELFSKQISDLKQIMQVLLLQQLQNAQSQQQLQQQQPRTIPAAKPTNVNKPNASNNNPHTNKSNNNNTNKNTTTITKSSATSTKTTTTKTATSPTTSAKTTINATPKNIKLNNTSPPVAMPVEKHVSSLAFRLTNGHVIKAQFSPSDSLSTAKEFVDKNRTDGKHKYILMTTYPKRVFQAEDYESTLSQLDLVPSSTLLLVSTDPGAKPLPHPETETSTTTTTTTTTSSTSTPTPVGSSQSPSPSGGMLSSVSNYVWGFFGSGSNPSGNSSEAAGKRNGSPWEYDAKKEENVKKNNEEAKDPEVSSVGIRNRKNVHQLNDNKKDDDKNNYWNGNSTQFQ